IWVSTTWSTLSMASSMWRWRWRSLRLFPSAWRRRQPRLRLPHLPHDHASQLVRVVVRGDPDVDDVSGDEPNIRVLGGVLRLEDDLRLTSCRHMRVIRVDQHEVEQVPAHVILDHMQVVVDTVAVGLAHL